MIKLGRNIMSVAAAAMPCPATALAPAAWEVKAVGAQLELSGPPLPGLGKNAELRIFDGAASGDDIRDPSQAKATVLVTGLSGLNAEARVLQVPEMPETGPALLQAIADTLVEEEAA